jgi:hexulose-6-phosphate isomerase
VPPTSGSIQCFPRDRWRDEFALAEASGLEAIEWIYDVHGSDINPISEDRGVAEMSSLSSAHGVAVASVCADFFMEEPLARGGRRATDERLGRLHWLLRRAALAGLGRLVLPFVDSSRIDGRDALDRASSALERTLPVLDETGVELHLETSLAPDPFRTLLDRVDHPMVKVNYDTGNSASRGYGANEEFAAYGHRVGSVHIKDRVKGGGTVPLGTGDTDFAAVADCLAAISYAGDLVLQVARGTPGDEVRWARRNVEFVRALGIGAG